jgi:hypothetical protein
MVIPKSEILAVVVSPLDELVANDKLVQFGLVRLSGLVIPVLPHKYGNEAVSRLHFLPFEYEASS